MLTIRREQKWLQKIVAEGRFDAIISDNRFGLWANKIPCVFITHQLLIQAPWSWLEKLVQKINYSYINRFTECWVPDFEAMPTLAGKLSHPTRLPAVPVKYIGALSRFANIEAGLIKYNWMIILSGPEPQRSMLETKLLAIIPALQGEVLLVRGKPGSAEYIEAPLNCTVVNHLGTAEMSEALAASEFVISRCGYTTVMEILSLGKKAVFIPTPGQTEQEYLASYLAVQAWCCSCAQHDDIAATLAAAQLFNYKLPVLAKTAMEEVVRKFMVG